MRDVLSVILFVLVGCGGSSASEEGAEEPQPLPDSNDPAYAASLDEPTDNRVSTSGGAQGGIIVLWPRVVPAGDGRSNEASIIQDRLRTLAERAGAGRPIDVRPEPQRACPHAGCQATAVGAVLVHQEAGCAVVATVSLPGRSTARLLEWSGGLRLGATSIPFRDPPESQIHVTDFALCADLATDLAQRDSEIEQAIREDLRD